MMYNFSGNERLFISYRYVLDILTLTPAQHSIIWVSFCKINIYLLFY
jgi:hypothetical protein